MNPIALKRITWLIVTGLMVLSLILSTSCTSDILPTALAAETQETIEQVKEENDDVFAEIQRNIDLVSELKLTIQDYQMDGNPTSLNNVIQDIETITLSYEKLAGQRDDIKRSILQKIERVGAMQATVDTRIKNLRETKAEYSDQLRLVTDPDPEISRTRKEALTRAIGYVDAQIRLWKEFNSIEWDILIEMSDIQKRIDSFLAMIESTSIVFREGLNLLYLQRDINEAIAWFTSDLPRMEQLTQDMEKSWDNLDYLIETLTGIANIGIKQ